MSVTSLLNVDKLVAVGLTKYEALAYLALLEKHNATALDLSDCAGIPRQRIYDTLDSLRTKGFCSTQAGRPRCYVAQRPEQALTTMLNYRKQQQAAENERQARLIQELIPSLTITHYGNDGEPPAFFQSDDDDGAHHDIGGF